MFRLGNLRLLSTRTVMGLLVLAVAVTAAGGGITVLGAVYLLGALALLGNRGFMEGGLVALLGLTLISSSLVLSIAGHGADKLLAILLSPQAVALALALIPILVIGWALLHMRPRFRDEQG